MDSTTETPGHVQSFFYWASVKLSRVVLPHRPRPPGRVAELQFNPPAPNNVSVSSQTTCLHPHWLTAQLHVSCSFMFLPVDSLEKWNQKTHSRNLISPSRNQWTDADVDLSFTPFSCFMSHPLICQFRLSLLVSLVFVPHVLSFNLLLVSWAWKQTRTEPRTCYCWILCVCVCVCGTTLKNNCVSEGLWTSLTVDP